MFNKIRNIVFSGAGTRIFLFMGFLKYIEENYSFKNVKTFAGTSSGSIVSLVKVLGYTAKELEELLLKIDFKKFNNIDSESIMDFFDNHGLGNTDYFEKVFRIMIKKKVDNDDITFKDLYRVTNKKLIIVATNLNKRKTVFFNYKDTPNIPVIDAVLASLSIPIVFKPRKINGDIYVDGAVTNNFAMDLFTNEINKTLGIIVFEKKEDVRINDLPQFLYSLCTCSLENKCNEMIEKYNNIIILNNETDFFNFDLTNDEKIKTIKDGYDQSYIYFKKKN